MSPRRAPVALAGLLATSCALVINLDEDPERRVSDGDSDTDVDLDVDTDTGFDADVDVDTDTDTDVDCVEPEVECEGLCVDVTTDDHNCGTCGRECGDGGRCLDGRCSCDGGEPCRPGEVCVDGACTCPKGFVDCGDVCTNVASDVGNCGECARRCPEGASCDSGRCQCPPGQVVCEDACVDTTSDEANCGACGRICRAECVSGICDCGDLDECEIPPARGGGLLCTDFEVDPVNCGACDRWCPPREYCAGGECVCRDGWTECPIGGGFVCQNTSRDVYNCGHCGNVCGGETPFCWDGVCVAACPEGATQCVRAWDSDLCVDTQTDVEHCGGCFRPCRATEICVGGLCVGYVPAVGCDDCPCESCPGDTSCCGFPGDPARVVCVRAAECP